MLTIRSVDVGLSDEMLNVLFAATAITLGSLILLFIVLMISKISG